MAPGVWSARTEKASSRPSASTATPASELTPRQRAGLGPHDPGRGRGAVAEVALVERARPAGHRQPGDDRPQLGVLGRRGRRQHRGEQPGGDVVAVGQAAAVDEAEARPPAASARPAPRGSPGHRRRSWPACPRTIATCRAIASAMTLSLLVSMISTIRDDRQREHLAELVGLGRRGAQGDRRGRHAERGGERLAGAELGLQGEDVLADGSRRVPQAAVGHQGGDVGDVLPAVADVPGRVERGVAVERGVDGDLGRRAARPAP